MGMEQATATIAAKEFHRFLGMVEHGESVQIRKHGRAVARLVPDSDFMSGAKAAALFKSYRADDLDKDSANAIGAEIAKLDQEVDHALAH